MFLKSNAMKTNTVITCLKKMPRSVLHVILYVICFLKKKRSIFRLLGGSSVFFPALGHSSPVEQLLFFGAVSAPWSHVSESWLIQFTVLIPGKH